MYLILHQLMEEKMRNPTSIPESARDELRAALDKANSKADLLRIQCVWLRASLGLSPEDIATATGRKVATVKQMQSRYLRGGKDALLGKGRGGRYHCNLSLKEEHDFLTPFIAAATNGGMLVVNEIKIAYERRIGRTVAVSTIYRLLARHNWRKIVPRPRHPKADSALQEAFKKTSHRS